MAESYTARYRSTYVLVIGLAAAAVLAGGLVPAFEDLHRFEGLGWLGGVEFLLLLAVVTLLSMSMRRDWHRKSIEYRLLTELFRKQKTLAALGTALPIGGVEHMADCEWLSWVAWLLAATQRAAPYPSCEVDSAGRTVLRIEELEGLIDTQIDYHRNRMADSRAAAESLAKAGTVCFGLLFFLAAVKVPLLAPVAPWGESRGAAHTLQIVELLALLLTSISAASLAVRSYAELPLLAEQSRTMVADLKQAKARVQRIRTARPLASQLLGEEATIVTTLMLQELEGWGRVFRGKLLETP